MVARGSENICLDKLFCAIIVEMILVVCAGARDLYDVLHFISCGIEANDSELGFLLPLGMEERSTSDPRWDVPKASSLVDVCDVI